MCVMTNIAWRWFILILFVPCLLLCMIKQMKKLAPLAFFGSICIFSGLLVVLWYCVFEKREAFVHAVTDRETMTAVSWQSLPIWFGIVVYAFEGIGLVIPMRKAMKQPDRFFATMSVSYALLALLFGVFSSVAMLTFGAETKQIVLANLPVHGRLDWLASVVRISVSVALFFTFNLQLFPVIEIWENALLTPHSPALEWKRFGVRAALTLICCLLAASIPHFGLFLSLIGNLGASLLMFILPAVLYTTCFWDTTSILSKMFVFFFLLLGGCGEAS
jgi:proton-coupled amino acid transporter